MKNKIITLAMAAAILALPSCNKEDAAMDNAVETPTSEVSVVNNKEMLNWDSFAAFLDAETIEAMKAEVAWLDAPATRSAKTIDDIDWIIDDDSNLRDPEGEESFTILFSGTFSTIQIKAVWQEGALEIPIFETDFQNSPRFDDVYLEPFFNLKDERRIVKWMVRTDKNDWATFNYWYQSSYYIDLSSNFATDLKYMIDKNGGTITMSTGRKGGIPSLFGTDRIFFRVVNDITGETIHELNDGQEPHLTTNGSTSLKVGKLPADATDNVPIRIEYFYDGGDFALPTNKSYDKYFADDFFDWHTFETGAQRYTEDLVLMKSYFYYDPAISPAGNTIRISMNKEEGSVFSYEDIEFQATVYYHRAYDEDDYDDLTIGGDGTIMGLNYTSHPDGYEGYVDIAFPAVVNPDGWVHRLTGNIASEYNLGAASWRIEYKKEGTGDWKELGLVYQKVYYLNVGIADKTRILPQGSTWTINQGGFFDIDEVVFRAVLEDGTPVSDPNGVAAASVTGTWALGGKIYIPINAHDGADTDPRSIYLQYKLTPQGQWETWNDANLYTRDWFKNNNYPVIQQHVNP